jgi:hypothetical protein
LCHTIDVDEHGAIPAQSVLVQRESWALLNSLPLKFDHLTPVYSTRSPILGSKSATSSSANRWQTKQPRLSVNCKRRLQELRRFEGCCPFARLANGSVILRGRGKRLSTLSNNTLPLTFHIRSAACAHGKRIRTGIRPRPHYS